MRELKCDIQLDVIALVSLDLLLVFHLCKNWRVFVNKHLDNFLFTCSMDSCF